MKRLALPVVACLSAAGPAFADSTDAAALKALTEVCGPASETSASVEDLAIKAGYGAQEGLPLDLVRSTERSKAWLAPSDEGRVYVISAVLPSPVTPSSCMVAVYGGSRSLFDLVFAKFAGTGYLPNFSMTADTSTTRTFKLDRKSQGSVDSILGVYLPAPAKGPNSTLIAYKVSAGALK